MLFRSLEVDEVVVMSMMMQEEGDKEAPRIVREPAVLPEGRYMVSTLVLPV